MITILLIPIVTSLLCYLMKNHRVTGYLSLAGSIALAGFSVPLIVSSVSMPLEIMNGMLYMDALSAYIMGLIVFLSLASSLYSIQYLEHELHAGLTNPVAVRRYYALFHLFIFTMLFVVVSNNLALMWIAIEATTIVSAVLIGLGFRKRELAIEAAWKYIILCTVGIIFALLGTFITYYASTAVVGTDGVLNWTSLRNIADKLNPATMKLAFVFVLVGYGTKAGLAPLHNWLPDAHSQAPSPISALLSGILLNTAFYGIIRFMSIVAPSTGAEFTGNLLMIFGMISIVLSSIFILVQSNYKRLLAYSSIEHMGIISLGAGIGGPVGMYGALLHILNHALSKPLMFFASGKIQAAYGSTRIENVRGVLTSMPLLGTLSFIGALSLAGTPPFNIFISEFTVIKAGVDKGAWLVIGFFLLSIVAVFYGIIAGFGKMLFNSNQQSAISSQRSAENGTLSGLLSNGIMIVMAVLIIVLGLHVPDAVETIIEACIGIIGRG
ncbi:MAG: hydrogenase 4 subunit F [Nitrospiraceae bacterium]|nr:MAG: hydrogenase 4 subunit F [Nitrospiraceae bacterium]